MRRSANDLMVGSSATDMLTNAQLPVVDQKHTLHPTLQPHQGLSLLVTPDAQSNTFGAAIEGHQHRRVQP